ncbi:MAG: response regulator, partial [Gammaproteobacteria bacterium]
RDPKTRSIPVVMVTTKDQESDRVWGMRQGAVDYLVKPVDGADLVAKANEFLKEPEDTEA